MISNSVNWNNLGRVTSRKSRKCSTSLTRIKMGECFDFFFVEICNGLFVHAMSLQNKLQSQWWKSMVKPNYYISNWFWNFINVRKFIGTNSPNYWEIFHWLKMSSILTDLLRLEIFLFDKLLIFHLSVRLTIYQD